MNLLLMFCLYACDVAPTTPVAKPWKNVDAVQVDTSPAEQLTVARRLPVGVANVGDRVEQARVPGGDEHVVGALYGIKTLRLPADMVEPEYLDPGYMKSVLEDAPTVKVAAAVTGVTPAEDPMIALWHRSCEHDATLTTEDKVALMDSTFPDVLSGVYKQEDCVTGLPFK